MSSYTCPVHKIPFSKRWDNGDGTVTLKCTKIVNPTATDLKDKLCKEKLRVPADDANGSAPKPVPIRPTSPKFPDPVGEQHENASGFYKGVCMEKAFEFAGHLFHGHGENGIEAAHEAAIMAYNTLIKAYEG